ncbi:heparan-alpha-glucosaminide N-acetyltransferase domain-containing protein [Geodermatophilus sp. SYSU D00703]
MTYAPVAVAAPPPPPRRRVTGVDLARGLALFGMMAKHIFDDTTDTGPTATGLIASGRSAATFALVAGISVAFLSGGRQILTGDRRRAAAAGLVVRAAATGTIGLLLGYAHSGIELILATYAVLFLCSIPLVGLRPKTLAALSVGFALLGPLLLMGAAHMGLPDSSTAEPTFTTLLSHPVGLLCQLFLTGDYPVVVYLAYLCAGLAIGRLDLTSRRPAVWLLGGGVALGVAATAVSDVLLYPLGGLNRLMSLTGQDAVAVLWEPPNAPPSWSSLALASPHAHTQLDLIHSAGSAMAVLGASLLVTRIAVLHRVLRPVRAAGAMTLTLYSAHILVLATGLFEDHELLQYLALVVGSRVFATHWRRWRAQGPLEELVGRAANRARRALLGPATPMAVRGRD